MEQKKVRYYVKSLLIPTVKPVEESIVGIFMSGANIDSKRYRMLRVLMCQIFHFHMGQYLLDNR